MGYKAELNREDTYLYECLAKHEGHNVRISKYGFVKGCMARECEDCNEIIFDTDVYDLCANEEE